MKECILLSATPHVALRDLALAIVIASLSNEVSVFVCRNTDCRDFDVSRLPEGSEVSAPSLLFMELECPGDPRIFAFRNRIAQAGSMVRGLSVEGRAAVYNTSMKCSYDLRQVYGDAWQHSRNAAWLTAMTMLFEVRDNHPQLAELLNDFAFLENVDRWSDRMVKLYLQSTEECSEEEWTRFINEVLREQLLIAS